MRIDILTLFPEMFSPLQHSMLGRAAASGILDVRLHNIRDYSSSKHKNTDDYPFGGGAGMVMMPQPVFSCLEEVDPFAQACRICLTPRGGLLTPAIARELAAKPRLLLLCGHYEGIDERVMGQMNMQLSIGDYVLTGGELPAMVLVDCLSRFIPGVLGSAESAEEESFSDGLLEYPQYTRPAEFRGMKVPEVLLGGNHAEIAKWRRKQALKQTMHSRPDLMARFVPGKQDKKLLDELEKE